MKTHMVNITNCQKTQPFKLLFKIPNTAYKESGINNGEVQ